MTVGYRQAPDEIVMRFMDGMLSFPCAACDADPLDNGFVARERRDRDQSCSCRAPPGTQRCAGPRNLEFEGREVRGESASYIDHARLLPNAMGPIVVETAIRLSFILLSTSLLHRHRRAAAAGGA
jgi:hypothetical protein